MNSAIRKKKEKRQPHRLISSYTIDRIGRGTVRAENICVSILGTTQPDKTLESAQQAVACCEYLESHARRIYGMVLDTTFEAFPQLTKAEELLAWIRKQSNGKTLTRRFILRYSKFRSSKDLDLLLSDLLQMGCIQENVLGNFSLCPQGE